MRMRQASGCAALLFALCALRSDAKRLGESHEDVTDNDSVASLLKAALDEQPPSLPAQVEDPDADLAAQADALLKALQGGDDIAVQLAKPIAAKSSASLLETGSERRHATAKTHTHLKAKKAAAKGHRKAEDAARAQVVKHKAGLKPHSSAAGASLLEVDEASTHGSAEESTNSELAELEHEQEELMKQKAAIEEKISRLREAPSSLLEADSSEPSTDAALEQKLAKEEKMMAHLEKLMKTQSATTFPVAAGAHSSFFPEYHPHSMRQMQPASLLQQDEQEATRLPAARGHRSQLPTPLPELAAVQDVQEQIEGWSMPEE